VSGLEGAFIGLNYSTNNFLGARRDAAGTGQPGNLARSILFGYTQPYLFDRPLQFGFTVFGNKISYNQARQLQSLVGRTYKPAQRRAAEPAELFAIERGLYNPR
jgi:outer membrane protein insertion porin family